MDDKEEMKGTDVCTKRVKTNVDTPWTELGSPPSPLPFVIRPFHKRATMFTVTEWSISVYQNQLPSSLPHFEI